MSTTCTVVVHYLPTAPGLRRGALVLFDTAPTPAPMLTVPLYAFSDAPLAALSPGAATVVDTGFAYVQMPFQIALDGASNIYVSSYLGSNVFKVAAGGGSASVVGTGSFTLNTATGVALDGAGNLFIADFMNNRIVVVTPGGVASKLTITGLPNTPATGEVLNGPTGLAADGAGNLYIADYTNSRIVKVSNLAVAGSSSTGAGAVIGTGSFVLASNGVAGVGWTRLEPST